MRSMLVFRFSLLAWCAAGCGHPPPGQPAGVPMAQADAPASPAPEPLVIAPAPVQENTRVRSSSRGAPHAGVIEHIVLAVDAPAALTRGATGDVRLWSAIDGSVEPIATPIPATRDMALARHSDGWRIAVIDTAGAASLWHYSAAPDGLAKFVQLFATSPHLPYVRVALVPGGAHALLLRSDHAVRLVDERGRVLAELMDREFRPETIQMASDGRTLITLSSLAEPKKRPGVLFFEPQNRELITPVTREVTVRTIRVAPGKRDPLALEARAIRFPVLDIPALLRVAVSADGRFAAYLQSTTAQESQVDVGGVDLATGARFNVVKNLPVGEETDIGFIDGRTALVAGSPEGRAWTIDIAAVAGKPAAAATRIHAVASAPGEPSQATPRAFGQGLYLSGSRRWLYVHDLARREQRYLGYRAFEPQQVAFAPGGRHLLWLAPDNAYVEPMDASEPVALIASRDGSPWTRGLFADDEHLLMLDSAGRLSLIERASHALVATADAGGVGSASLDYDPARNLLLVRRQSHDAWLYELDLSPGAKSVFSGPHVMRTGRAIQSGLLGGTDALWTVDQDRMLRTFTLDEIRARPSYAAMLSRGGRLNAPDGWQLMTIDRRGVRYHVEQNRLAIYDHDQKERELTLERDLISRIEPSPDGQKFAIVSGSARLAVYQRTTGARLWSHGSVAVLNDLAWSSDSARLAVVSAAGGLLFDADTGTPAHRSCGPWFQVRRGAPPQSSSNVTHASMCGL